jgi:PAS domain S-box-containing protein
MKLLGNLQRSGLVLLSCGLALAVAWPLDAPSSCFFLAVMLSSLYGGKEAGLASVVLSALAFDYFFLPPRLHWAIEPSSYPRFAVFLGATLLITGLIEAKRRVEESRRKIDAQYRTIADTAPDAILAIDGGGRIAFMNPAATRIFGWSAAEGLGQPVTNLMPEFRVTNQTPSAELAGLRKDGTVFSAEVSFGQVPNLDHSEYAVFVRDISDRKLAEQRLGTSESFLSRAQSLSHTGSFGWNVSTGEVFWSEETYKITGYPLEVRPSLQLVFDRIAPDDRAKVQEAMTLASQSGGDLDFEHRLVMPDGSVKYVQIFATPSNPELGTQYVGAVMDITSSKRVENDLRRTEAYLEEAQRLSHTGSWVWNVAPPGPAYWSAELYRIAGRDPAQGPPSMEEDRLLHPPEDWAGLLEAAERAVLSKGGFEYDSRFICPDGTFKNIHIVGHAVLNEAGEASQLAGTTIDVTEQRHARLALQKAFDAIKKSEDQLRVIINTIPTLAWSARPDGSIQFFNQRWLDYTGLSAEQALDWRWMVAIHPDDRDRLTGHWTTTLASSQPAEVEARLRRHDGEYRWFLFRVSPLRDPSGRVVKWYGTNTDIEDRRRAEEAVRASEHHFRLMVNSVPGLVQTMTAAGEVEVVNQRVLDYFGKTEDELKDWQTFVHPDDTTRVVTLLNRSIETGLPFDVEHRVRRADGVYRWFHSRSLPLHDAEGRIARWYHLLTDIEDRKRAEEALRASERDLALIIETIPALVWSAAPDGQLSYVNKRVLDYTGASLDALAKAGWIDFLHPDDVEPTVRSWNLAVETGQPHEIEYRLRCQDGAYRWFHVLGQLGRDGDGRMTRWYGLLIDIDDRKTTEEALRNTQTRLSQATQIATVGELAASIAHEINQPLAAVVANGHACLRWLSAEPPSLGKAREAAHRIVRDGKDAGEVVRRIRALFKRAALEKVALDLNQLITEVLRLLGGETGRRRIAVETYLEVDLAPVLGDRVQLQQLVLNLLVNGMEAMDPVQDRPKRLRIRSARHQESVLVEVLDCGIGLEDPDKVFEAFFSTKENGMGMGLAICRSIVEAHDGAIWAAPGEGSGATFSFTLPVLSNRAVQPGDGA